MYSGCRHIFHAGQTPWSSCLAVEYMSRAAIRATTDGLLYWIEDKNYSGFVEQIPWNSQMWYQENSENKNQYPPGILVKKKSKKLFFKTIAPKWYIQVRT